MNNIITVISNIMTVWQWLTVVYLVGFVCLFGFICWNASNSRISTFRILKFCLMWPLHFAFAFFKWLMDY
jgi:hypothetical protein